MLATLAAAAIERAAEQRRRMAILAALGRLSSAQTITDAIRGLTEALVPAVADGCWVDLIEPDGESRRLFEHGVDAPGTSRSGPARLLRRQRARARPADHRRPRHRLPGPDRIRDRPQPLRRRRPGVLHDRRRPGRARARQRPPRHRPASPRRRAWTASSTASPRRSRSTTTRAARSTRTRPRRGCSGSPPRNRPSKPARASSPPASRSPTSTASRSTSTALPGPPGRPRRARAGTAHPHRRQGHRAARTGCSRRPACWKTSNAGSP